MLSISENKKYFTQNGQPFFWQGDTAWLLFQKCSLEEAYRYLRNRSELGFNVIQAVLINNIPNQQNTGSLVDGSTNVTTKEYWDKCDKIIAMAEQLHMYIAVLPSWGSLVKSGILNEENAKEYAEFLGSRYQNAENIIWLLGGDVKGKVGGQTFHI